MWIAQTRLACRPEIWLQALHRVNSAFTLEPNLSASAWGQLSRPGWRSRVMAHMVGSAEFSLTRPTGARRKSPVARLSPLILVLINGRRLDTRTDGDALGRR